jgi:PAS domain S-box-containing protein
MKVKTKIMLGLVFLFSVIVILSIISIHYLNVLTVQNQKLLKDDYRSLENVHGMMVSLNEIRNSFEPVKGSRVSINKVQYKIDAGVYNFEEYLKKQKLSIGEDAEEKLVNSIAVDFEMLVGFIKVTRTKDYYFEKLIPLMQEIDSKINQVYTLNRQTIEHQNEMAKATARQVIYTVAGIVSFCIIVAFAFMVGFPRIVAEPVEKLATAINEIKNGDYNARVEIHSRDEFGDLGMAFNSMSKRLSEYEKLNVSKLMTEKKRIETMIRKLSEGIIGFDSDFKILFINPFARELLGLKEKKVIGKPAAELAFANDTFHLALDDLLEYAKSNKRYTRNKLIKGQMKDKPAYFIRKVILSYSKKDGEEILDGYILMLKNITEYKERDEARTNFIATVSHELKTPLSAIKMSLRLLRDERLSKLSETQEELIDDLEGEANRLLNITQELLNANELETGKIQLHPEKVRADEIIEEAIDSVLTMAEDRNVLITEEIASDIPPLYVDQDKTTWVLINFLTNAIKYSPKGAEVNVKAFVENQNFVVSVTDTGQGIAPEEQTKIFERFYRIQGSDGKGTGLGLSISKEIITQMGGTIGVESEKGKGSTFSIKLQSPFAQKPV